MGLKQNLQVSTNKELEISSIKISNTQPCVLKSSEYFGQGINPFKNVTSNSLKTFGRYQIQEKLGSGGMGKIYKAYDPYLDRIVALKVMNENINTGRFLTEAKINAKLIHSNIPKIFDLGQEANQLYLAMEFIEGKSLKQLIEEKTLDIKTQIKLIKTIAKTLEYVHSKGIVHCDIKPANIMINNHGKPYLIDFGLAKLINKAKCRKNNILAGTPYYMSPEQANTESEIDIQSDIYSLGVTFYEMLTGQLPFQAKNRAALLVAIAEKMPDLPRSINEKIPKYIEKICLRAMQKDKTTRFKTMTIFLNAFDSTNSCDLNNSHSYNHTSSHKTYIQMARLGHLEHSKSYYWYHNLHQRQLKQEVPVLSNVMSLFN